ncbi:MAG: HNH endonuclease signature motif containing protein, partial [Gemmatimonadota bacterium]
IACDAAVVRITRGRDGGVLGAGRRTRTIAPALRRALEARDRGCRFPGCAGRFTDGHHVVHWAEGGETSLRNLVLLCRRHHRAVHEGRVRVCLGKEGAVAFFTPGGRALYDAPRAANGGTGAGRAAGARTAPGAGRVAGAGTAPGPGSPRPTVKLRLELPAHRTGAARWTRDSLVPWPVEAGAREALEADAEMAEEAAGGAETVEEAAAGAG